MEATRNVATTALDAAKDTLANGERGGQEGLFRQVFLAAREAAGEVLEREARSAARQAAEVLTTRAPEIAREQLEKRGGSNAAGRAAVEYGRAKLQGAGGTKALTAAAVGAAKGSAGGLRTKVTDALSGEKGEDAEGGTSRLPVEVSIDIGAPRQVVWDEWTQFESSPESLHRIQSTEDGALKVSAKIWGSTKEEEVEITDQLDEERLAWRAYGAIPYRGVVTFHSLDENLTRLLVTLEFEPQGLLARLGAAVRRSTEASKRTSSGSRLTSKRVAMTTTAAIDSRRTRRRTRGSARSPRWTRMWSTTSTRVSSWTRTCQTPTCTTKSTSQRTQGPSQRMQRSEPEDATESEPEEDEESEPEEDEEPTPRRRASRASAASPPPAREVEARVVLGRRSSQGRVVLGVHERPRRLIARREGKLRKGVVRDFFPA